MSDEEMNVHDGPLGRWMSIPLAPEEVGILQGLPEQGKREFEENVHRYIKQVGDDYQVTPVPTPEAAGIISKEKAIQMAEERIEQYAESIPVIITLDARTLAELFIPAPIDVRREL